MTIPEDPDDPIDLANDDDCDIAEPATHTHQLYNRSVEIIRAEISQIKDKRERFEAFNMFDKIQKLIIPF